MIRFRAEIKVSGRAWLEFLFEHQLALRTLLTQTAFLIQKAFSPSSAGACSTTATCSPIHALIFSEFIHILANEARALDRI